MRSYDTGDSHYSRELMLHKVATDTRFANTETPSWANTGCRSYTPPVSTVGSPVRDHRNHVLVSSSVASSTFTFLCSHHPSPQPPLLHICLYELDKSRDLM